MRLSATSQNFTGRILFMSMFNVISCVAKDNAVIPSKFCQHIINSGKPPGSQKSSKRQKVFFLLVGPRVKKKQWDPDVIDLNAPHRAQHIHSAWKRHQDNVYWVDIKLKKEKIEILSVSIECNHSVSFWEQHGSDIRASTTGSRSRAASFSSEEFCRDSRLRSLPAFVHFGGQRLSFLVRFRPSFLRGRRGEVRRMRRGTPSEQCQSSKSNTCSSGVWRNILPLKHTETHAQPKKSNEFKMRCNLFVSLVIPVHSHHILLLVAAHPCRKFSRQRQN